MKLFIFLALVALVASAPTSNDTESSTPATEDIIRVNGKYYAPEFRIYNAYYNIVEVHYPVNALNLGDDNDDSKTKDRYLFFVEADDDGKFKGISVLINDKSHLLLNTGTSIASGVENEKVTYFGATDGLYIYNGIKNEAEQYGTIKDSIIDIAKANGTDEIYILTDKNEVYKVTENGTKKDLVPQAAGAREIVLDDSNNLYFYGEDKKISVLTAEGVKKVEGLPEAWNIKLLNPAFVMEQSVPVIVGYRVYYVSSNGSVEIAPVDFYVLPSAVSVESTLKIYMAKGNSIYEYDILAIILGDGDILKNLKDFLKDKTDDIQSLSTRSRSDI